MYASLGFNELMHIPTSACHELCLGNLAFKVWYAGLQERAHKVINQKVTDVDLQRFCTCDLIINHGNGASTLYLDVRLWSWQQSAGNREVAKACWLYSVMMSALEVLFKSICGRQKITFTTTDCHCSYSDIHRLCKQWKHPPQKVWVFTVE